MIPSSMSPTMKFAMVPVLKVPGGLEVVIKNARLPSPPKLEMISNTPYWARELRYGPDRIDAASLTTVCADGFGCGLEFQPLPQNIRFTRVVRPSFGPAKSAVVVVEGAS